MAEAREERIDSSNAPIVELDDLDEKPLRSLIRIRTWRIVRLALCVIAVPVGWTPATHLPGLLPVFGLALSVGGTLVGLTTIYLLVHVQKAIGAARYEDSFSPR